MSAHGGGPAIGKRYKGKVASYDPSSGRTYRTAVALEPEYAVRLLTMAERAGMSVSGFLNALVKNAAIDPETGLPPFIAPAPADSDSHLFQEAS